MKEPQRQLQQDTKQEVIKHSAAIQIENNMTLLQRRAWNALLFNAYNELDKKEEHQISLRYLCLLYTSPSPRDRQKSRMPSSA